MARYLSPKIKAGVRYLAPREMPVAAVNPPTIEVHTDTGVDGDDIQVWLTLGGEVAGATVALNAVLSGVSQPAKAAVVAGTSGFAEFLDLPPGEYAVVATASNSAGTTIAAAYPVITIGEISGTLAAVNSDGLILRRALINFQGVPTPIRTSQLGTGLKPLVLFNGKMQQRRAGEGVPLVRDGVDVRRLRAGEALEV